MTQALVVAVRKRSNISKKRGFTAAVKDRVKVVHFVRSLCLFNKNIQAQCFARCFAILQHYLSTSQGEHFDQEYAPYHVVKLSLLIK